MIGLQKVVVQLIDFLVYGKVLPSLGHANSAWQIGCDNSRTAAHFATHDNVQHFTGRSLVFERLFKLARARLTISSRAAPVGCVEMSMQL
jgi:hypothetical protein